MTLTQDAPAIARQTLDLEEMFPDLFEHLTPDEARVIVQTWACQWHEGWVPNRADVADSIQVDRGLMTIDDAARRAAERSMARV